ncbi:MAG: FkbM family methyltransferase [Saprospiraceae bacterium]|nr:FkbM family methyltransferase [Saprospiraceae bacterium]
MIHYLAFLLRKISIFLISRDITYYPGMVSVRIGRKLREITYREGKNPDFQTIQMFKHIKIYVDRFSYMGGSIFWTGFHHLNEVLFLNKYLSPDMTFIDIGANQGEFTLLAASKLTSGHVLAFEPVSLQRKLLEKNKEINNFNNIKIFDYGLGDKLSQLPIYTSEDTNLHHGRHEGLSSLYSSSERNILQEIIDIKVFDDLFLNQLDRLDFIKIDIEGAELYALKGMIKSIQKFKPTVLIEINEDTFNSAGYHTSDVILFFKDYNYSFYKISKGHLIESKIQNFDKWGNYIAKCNVQN